MVVTFETSHAERYEVSRSDFSLAALLVRVEVVRFPFVLCEAEELLVLSQREDDPMLQHDLDAEPEAEEAPALGSHPRGHEGGQRLDFIIPRIVFF